jgi:GxxExxY protein
MTRIRRIFADLIREDPYNPRHPRSIRGDSLMSDSNLLHADITAVILKAFYHVYNTLGYGFLDKVYENALKITLRKWGLSVSQQQAIKVYFEREEVGEYFADLIVDEKVILELKAAESICSGHESQLVNYLKATDIEVGLLLNFGPKPEFRRKIFRNERKTCRGE